MSPLLCAAQGVARIELGAAHHFMTFAATSAPKTLPKGQEHEGGTADVSLPAEGTLYVWDRDTGNLAQKPAKEVGKLWRIPPRELSLIGMVIVHVEHEGEPVAAARVVLKDKGSSRGQLIDSSSEGEAQFFAVQPGKVTVTVEYRSGGTDATPVTQLFDLPLERSAPDPILRISLPDPVQTVAPTTPSPPTPAAPQPKPAAHSFLGSLLIYLIGLAAAAGLGYYAYRMALKHPDWVRDRLGRFGVTTQDAQPAADPVVAPEPTPIVPPAPMKIILDDAPPAPAPSTPRLVKPTGESVPLAEGESVVGREAGLPVSLSGESSVSRRHAAFVRQGGTLMLRDLSSTNGTFVNGRRIDSDTPLRAGDDVQFGAVKFRVEGL